VRESRIESYETLDFVGWRPKPLRFWKNGPTLYEILSNREVWRSIPSDDLLKLLVPQLEKPRNKEAGPYYVVSLNPPYDYIKVLRCPNCLKIIRAAAEGAPVVCLECGFPNKVLES